MRAPNTGHSKKYPAEYQIWLRMLARVAELEKDRLPDYCCAKSWRMFIFFIKDMGKRKPGQFLAMRKPEEGYFPENCYWSDKRKVSTMSAKSKLTLAKVLRIHKQLDAGVSAIVLGERYDVSRMSINKIQRGIIWADAFEQHQEEKAIAAREARKNKKRERLA